jgi:hypothetical protein
MSLFSFDGAHFMLTNVLSNQPLNIGLKQVFTQTFWDPQMYDKQTGALPAGWYFVGLTVTPDQKARLDVFSYSGTNRQFLWNQGYLDAGVPASYTQSSSSRTPRGSYYRPDVIGTPLYDYVSGSTSYQSQGFPTLSAPAITWYAVKFYGVPFTQDLMLAAFSNLTNNGASAFNNRTGTALVQDSDLQGYTGSGSPNPEALYPCNSGAFLNWLTNVPAGYINTPCQTQKPIVSPPPMVDSMSPTEGSPGTQVRIAGSGFGNFVSGSSAVTFTRETASALIKSWSDTEILVVVPQSVTGPVTVVLPGVTANAGAFIVN